jgi:hypothetical protein
MANLPKLKVNKSAWSNEPEQVQTLEEAKSFPFHEELIIVAEGKQINSYDDLLNMVQQEPFRNKEYLEVFFLPMIFGG